MPLHSEAGDNEDIAEKEECPWEPREVRGGAGWVTAPHHSCGVWSDEVCALQLHSPPGCPITGPLRALREDCE